MFTYVLFSVSPNYLAVTAARTPEGKVVKIILNFLLYRVSH
jgi:hypothetical protein